MEGISKYLRLRTATVVAALAAATAVALAMAGSANALVGANDITIRVIDNTQHSISAAFCPNGHAINAEYGLGLRADPCNYTPFTVPYIAANGGRYPEGSWPSTTYTANPLGVIVRFRLLADRKPLYFYAKNPIIGAPYFEYSYGGDARRSVTMGVQGEILDRVVGPTVVRFHRGGDHNGYKVMTIELCGASTAYCRA